MRLHGWFLLVGTGLLAGLLVSCAGTPAARVLPPAETASLTIAQTEPASVAAQTEAVHTTTPRPEPTQPATASPLGIAAVEHLVHEPFALLRTEIVAQERLDGLLRKAGLELPQAVAVNYASPCPVYGQQTVHMVVQQPSGPVSVIYFPRRESDALGDFRHGPTNGRALAYGDGMLVLMANDDAGIGAVEAIWQSAMLAGEPSGQLIAGMD